MRFDPDDYAFTAHYDPAKLTGEVKSLAKQGLMRLISVAVSILVVVLIWSNAGRTPPTEWSAITRVAGITLAAVLVVAAVVAIIEKFAAPTANTGFQTVILVVLFTTSGALLYPVTRLIGFAESFKGVCKSFVLLLKLADDSDAAEAAAGLLSFVTTTHTVLLVSLVAVAVVVVAALALLVSWLLTPRSLGWRQRNVMQTALWLPAGLMIVSSAWLVLLSRRQVPNVEKLLGDDVVMPEAPILTDWLMWLLLAGLTVTVVTLLNGAVRTATASILLSRMPEGPALRVDPLGMVVDDDKTGPQRLIWPAIDVIAGRPRSALPGPELEIGRSGQSVWSVPFMYLDVMPGTIDSAVRAHTQDRRELDLSPMDQPF